MTEIIPYFLNPERAVYREEPYLHEVGIEDVLLIKRPNLLDRRGQFQEFWRLDDIEEAIGRDVKIRQFQMSESRPNVLRGVHVEPQDKIITPLVGKFRIALVDFRQESSTYLKLLVFDLNLMIGSPKYSVFIPEGVGNSFCVFPNSPHAYYLYGVSQTYNPSHSNMGVRWNSLGIDWPSKYPELSDRDKNLPTIEQFVLTQLGRQNG